MSRAKYFLGSVIRRIIIAFLIAQISAAPLLTAFARTPLTSVVSDFIPGSFFTEENTGKQASYVKLMRELTKLSDSKIVAKNTRAKAAKEIDNFIAGEKKRLDDLKVAKTRQNDYFNLLGKLKDEASTGTRLKRGRDKLRIPEHPASFGFNDKEIRIKSLKNTTKKKVSWSILKFIKNIAGIETAFADDQSVLPKLADVQADSEVVITSEIRDIASALNNNPVEIFNFVRNTISYEPYFGAKKGSVGCLYEKICNDTDTSSLMIALLRAGGIPAHYKKGIAIMPVQQLKTFLGVDETKTVYAAFALNDVPVYTLQDANSGKKLNEADFSIETHLAVEWMFAEAYYDYDEQGANINNTISFDSAKDDYDVKNILSSYPKKQWIPMEAIIKPYSHTKKEILADTASFDTQTFWTNFFKYQGDLSPFAKYAADLQSATGKSIYDNLSTVSPSKKDYSILPSTLPYAFKSGTVDGKEILIETFSSLADGLRYKVKISLLKDSDKSTVISKTFFGSEINNEEIDLLYDGATETDKNVINSYGGIHATPSSLVNIIPYFQKEYERFDGTVPVKIGDSLVLKFEYFIDASAQKTDEKFSVAGNSEGIYIALSTVLSDPSLDTDSNILLRGNVGLARKYLEQVEKDGTTLEQSLDYTSQTHFVRAVVTQNRVLNEIGGTPTTFDFKGLSIDAAAYINDYSNRGDFKNHRKDFRLIWGQQASYYEGQVFTDITGLNAISTVKGLQYAYSKPADYTIYTITSANESVIDGLALSENTKSNMHADVAKGNTITTPGGAVEKGVWTGILYVSLDPAWTGTYAIGEQSQSNGGDSTDLVAALDWWDEFNKAITTYIAETQKQDKFLYEDKPADSQSVLCKISKSEFDDVKTNSGWKPEYGFPCAKKTKQFGTVNHTYTLSTNAAKFEGTNTKGSYGYWATYASVVTKLKDDKYKDNLENLSDIDLDGTFKFNPIAGTYSWAGHYGTYNDLITAYYEPTADEQGKGHVVYGKILSKLQDPHYNIQQANMSPAICSLDNNYCGYNCDPEKDDYCAKGKYNWILNILGYPTDNRKTAAEYVVDWGINTKGQYQDFAGGQIYFKTSFFNKTYYVPDKIAEFYNDPAFAIDGKIGSGGQFGFPTSDPKFKNNGYVLKQNFENEGIVYNTQTGVVQTEYAGDYYCDEIDTSSDYIVGEAFLNGLWDGGSILLKGAIVFGASTAALGAGIDAVLGTHGGATIAAWALIGTGVAVGISEVYAMGIDNFLAGLDSKLQYEIKNSTCLARQAYLFAKYVPGFMAVMVGLKQLAKKTPSALKGITLTNNIFTLSKNEAIQQIKTAFIENVNLFIPVFKKGKDDAFKVIDDVQEKFNNESLKLVKEKGEALTEEELSGIASKTFSSENLLKTAIEKLGWEKLVNKKTYPEDIKFTNEDYVVKYKPQFIVKNNKIRNKYGWDLNGEFKVVVDDGKVSYFKAYTDKVSGTEESHAKLVGGKSIDGSYTIRFNNKGELIVITDLSGHYETPFERLILLEYLLKISGVDISKMEIYPWQEYIEMVW